MTGGWLRRPVLVLVAILLASCGGSDSDAPSDEGSDSTATPETTADAEDLPDEALFGGTDETIELLTATSGGGIRPLLEWTEISGAVSYTAMVYAPDGSPYWSWSGPATSVHVSGEPPLDDDTPGPAVSTGMTWAVVAFDDGSVPIAVSPPRPIDP